MHEKKQEENVEKRIKNKSSSRSRSHSKKKRKILRNFLKKDKFNKTCISFNQKNSDKKNQTICQGDLRVPTENTKVDECLEIEELDTSNFSEKYKKIKNFLSFLIL